MDFRIRKSIIIFAVVSISAALVGAFFFAVERPQAEKDTSEWSTYTNEEYGFEFKYPPERKNISVTDEGKKVCTMGMCVEIEDNDEKLSFFGLKKKITIREENLLLWLVNVDKGLGWAYTRDEGESPEKIILKHDGKIFTFRSGYKIDRDILSTFKFVK